MEVPIIISDENNKSEISSRKKLKNRLTTGTFALLIALFAVVSATYAWYVYNTGRHTTKVRMAAGAVGEVSEIAPEDISDGEDVGSQEAEEILNDGETSVEQPDSADASDTSNPQVEIVLPQKNVFIPVSEFLPVQEREELLSLISHDEVYLVHIRDDSEMQYSIFFNQALEQKDVCLYRFDSEENKVVDADSVQDVMSFDENNRTLVLNTKDSSDYVLVISNAEKYKELGYTASIAAAQQQTEPSETGEEETENKAATEVALTSVILKPDSELETVPVAFLEYLSDLDVCSVTLVYADGSEKMLDKEDGRYECSAEHADEEDAEGTVRRTYHVVVKELATGAVFEDTESVEIGRKDPVEIKTEDMTTVMLEGRKKWMMVQSVPDVSGRYAMNCDKGIEKIYYVSDDGDLTCAEDSFQLQAGEKYTFLIKLQ
ncbi:hypothetical protein [Blautia sp. MCC283]|uniref:hypothetical protein n=1 Tax=Blautia sp. MCC283 TaxID=2592640 RepID=UPI001C0295FC|nr:hypothetical protein [Blautia sp. MCC283]MBT9841930.1 hypothetical protein [Blautia sp. MCC283]